MATQNLQNEPAIEDDRTTTPPHADREAHTGISNRETPEQEEKERRQHPPKADEEPQSRPHKAG